MRHNSQRHSFPTDDQQRDPREGQGATVIDLATRNVLPAVTQRRPRSERLGLAGGIAIVAALGGLTLWSMDAARNAPVKAVPQQAVPAIAPVPIIAAPPLAVKPAVLVAPSPAQQPVLAAMPANAPAPSPMGNPYAAPAVTFDASTSASGPISSFGLPIAGPSATGTGNANEDFASRIGMGNGGAATATAMVDPKNTVTQGTLIPAILETAIDTDVPGYVRAVVSADVRSFDGSKILVPHSSRLIGQYKSGLQAGQRRAYVIWTRLIRPDGVSVNIGSPAVGFSGETGLSGKVSTHFFERFGSAMLLSVVGGLSAIGGNAGVVIGGSGQSAAAAAVGQTGQIGPTIRVRQGEPIRVFTARDLDFSKVSSANVMAE